MKFDLSQYEVSCYRRDRESAARQLVDLLQSLDSNYGLPCEEFHARPQAAMHGDLLQSHLWTRVAAATSCLLSDPEFWIADEWQLRILNLHRWLSAIFSASPFRNADHILRSLRVAEDESDNESLVIKTGDILKFILLYTSESEISLNLDSLWTADKRLTAGLCLVLLSPRFLGSRAAHGKREVILGWLTEKLDQIEDIEQLPFGVLHDAYMHCSYADRTDKHSLKKPINSLIRRKLNSAGLNGLPKSADVTLLPKAPAKKPCMVVVVEWFTKNHSIYRTHSLTIEHAKEKFHIVAIGYLHCIDEVTREVFDEFVPLDSRQSMLDQLRVIQKLCQDRSAQICYMPSVGMFPLTMWLSNLRVAPLQMMALGHPATTHSDAIDYVVVEMDYVGDPGCFSENLLMLPKDGMPYRPSAAANGIEVVKTPDSLPRTVRIAVCSTTMKLNPNFLGTCARIVKEANVDVHFHFLIGQNQGLITPLLESVIREYLGDRATVYPHQSYLAYMDKIAGCDMYINPFPFGNTNGIIDTTTAGLVGVCKTGPEVHEHIDEGLFKRIGLPQWLVAKSVDEYVRAAVRLAENHAERLSLRAKYAGVDKVQVLFSGRPKLLGEKMYLLLAKREKANSSNVTETIV